MIARRRGIIAVLAGGTSSEKEISRLSGKNVLRALSRLSIPAVLRDPSDGDFEYKQLSRYQKIFIALHGGMGENGSVQGLLECLGIPYTGSGVLASALAMDKGRSKAIWENEGLPTAPGVVLETATMLPLDYFEKLICALGSKAIVKPAQGGSSIGVRLVHTGLELQQAVKELASDYSHYLVERFLEGAEYSVSILGHRVLPSVKILPGKRPIYDYDAKYHARDTIYQCPSDLSPKKEGEIQELALAAYHLLGCSGWGRIDFKMDQYQKPYLLEANTVPGLSATSLVPIAAAQAGFSFDALVRTILDSAPSSRTP